MADYTLKDLEYWDARIREKVEEFGLDCYPQEFELCDHNQMLGYMAYSGMPSHYPHWSYGKAYEKLKTLYDHGVSGLPYEMVINSSPALAYLMRDNTLCLQILTIAHVYGHNDFFKNNFTFQLDARRVHDRHLQVARRPRAAPTSRIRASAPRRSRRSSTPPTRSRCSAAATSPYASSRPSAERDRLTEAASRPPIPSRSIHRRQEQVEVDLKRTPAVARGGRPALHPRPQSRFSPTGSATSSPSSTRSAQYFIPQIETKIMNEGWASFWHKRILDTPRPAAGAAPRVPRAPQPGRAADPGRSQPVPPRAAHVGGHRALRQRSDARRARADSARARPGATCSSRPARSTATCRSSAAGWARSSCATSISFASSRAATTS